MQFNEQELQVLKNFAMIHQSMVIQPTGVKVINTAKSCIGMYNFETPYDFPEFGVYEMHEFLSYLSAFKNPNITVQDMKVVINEGTAKVTYFTTAKDLLPVAKDVTSKFVNLPIDMDFIFPQEKMTMLLKMASLLKAEFIFFESVDDGKIRITVGDKLESSNNTWEVTLDSDITVSTATEAVRCSVSELRLLVCDYHVKITKGISLWVGTNKVKYFVGMVANKK